MKWTEQSGTEGRRGVTHFLHDRYGSGVTAACCCPTDGETVATDEVYLSKSATAAPEPMAIGRDEQKSGADRQ